MVIKKQEEISKEEQIGFHKGALQTLAGERNELVKMLQITEGLMQAHAQALEKSGVKLFKEETKSKVNSSGNLESGLGRNP